MPVALLNTVFWIASSDVRVSPGIRTRIVYGRAFAISGTVASTPSSIEVASSATSVGVKPSRAATVGFTWKFVAGPLIVFSMPFCTSTTPGILLMASPTCGPNFCSSAASVEKNLDLDRFRRVGKVADHVLQRLDELHVQLRLGLLDLLAHIRHHFVDPAIAFALQLHRDVAGVGFGHGGQPHLQAGAPRCGLHLRSAAQDLLHMRQHAVRLGQ